MGVRWSMGLVAVVCAVGVVDVCSGADPSSTPSPTSTAPVPATTRTPPSTAATIVRCSGVGELNQDDDDAAAGLLRPSQLPAGTWTVTPEADGPPCPWALSADELLAVPQCLDAAKAAGAAANDEARNGNAHNDFARSDGVQLDDRFEIYTSRQNVDALRAILTGPAAPACFEAAVKRRASSEPSTTVGDISVEPFAVQPDAAALRVGFPASDGYAADAGFAEGTTVTFTRTNGAGTEPVAMRVVTFGSGGAVRTVTLIGTTPAELEPVDLTATLGAAADRYRARFGGST